ncbi:MAG TPA: glycine/betaine ABC transporter substrate-binding protein [Acetobacteraceae bacterium]|jgi:molybdate transport system substrate-binding protein|nr:glycine/betaine ABC transporter substrate-binding protein [Acetobacteraceae bacterium]
MNRLLLAAGGLLLSAAAALAAPPGSPAAKLEAAEALYPPWQGGTNSGAPAPGLVFTVPPADSMADFHGSLDNPALVLYASGNYFFAMRGMVRAFGEAYPAYRGHVFYETLPPGLLMKQIAAGGTVTSGNLTFTVKPDVMMAEQRASEAWVKDGQLVAPVVSFATNELTIMVPAGNPAHIGGLADLARPDLTLVMPNPAFEGVARQIRASLVKAGGEALAKSVYETKVSDGTAILTRIHHRQTPLFLMQGLGQAGVTWTSEALFQEQQGHPISHVAIPADQNTTAIYSAAMVPGAPHVEAARAWLEFIRSDAAFAAMAPFGFKRLAQ